jgi:hypothetical protein
MYKYQNYLISSFFFINTKEKSEASPKNQGTGRSDILF